jgi:hypothetical protein
MYKPAGVIAAGLLAATIGVSVARAECQIADAKLEEAISRSPKFHGAANRQTVKDLRSLRDAAFTLWTYGKHAECERLVITIRELVSVPAMNMLGDSDEDEAEKQLDAREPVTQRNTAVGRRANKGALPLISIEELAPGLRADEIIGVEVRSADDKIVGEVRNVVFGTRDRKDYAIVASGGFFTASKESIIVPIPSLKVTQERDAFFLPLDAAAVRAVPRMPDSEYNWLNDTAWRSGNDTLFQKP